MDIPPPVIPPPQQDYPVNIEDIMHTAYLQYSLSVNVGRAIPDVRDGLKPVNRRILFAMRQLNLSKSHAYSKCAKVVGEVIGNYHPHGDSSIYDALVRMAQDFSLRYPLIDGQGNFGSIDGDAAAAYRYTECRMERLAEELMADLEKDTCDHRPTYNEERMEPEVLPARFPNLLVNGSTGIGVGMATNIPPHNLAEVIDATVHLMEFPRSSPRDLMQFIKGPDFPTGATIVGLQPIISLYETGHGIISVRGKARIEEHNDRERIIITEIPYMLNKEMLVTKIAELHHNKIIAGISDLRDESSSRAGIRIVVDVKRDQMATVVLNQLYKHSQLQTSFGAQFLVVDKNRPRTLNLVQILQAYIDHRLEVITRRTRFELAKAEARAHILEGLIIAVDNIDEVVQIIRRSQTRDEAQETLMTRFLLSKRQTQAILDMRLSQLTGLAIDELRAEYDALMIEIERLKALLASRELRLALVKSELIEVREKFADKRRTEIMAGDNEINIEDLIKRSICAITVSNTGYIKRLEVDTFRTQRRGGKGVMGMQTKDEDYVQHLFTACTHDYILFFTNKGRMHWLKVYEIPETQRTSRGKAIINLIEMEPDESIRAMLTVSEIDVDDQYLVFCTRRGFIKKTAISEFKHMRRIGIRAIHLEEDDDLIEVKTCTDEQQIMLFSSSGMAARFDSGDDQLRGMGRTARGVIGIRLRDEDTVVSMEIVTPGDDILCITSLGMGKRSNIGTGIADQDTETGGYRLTNRGSRGVTAIKLRDEEDSLLVALRIEDGAEIIMTTQGGQVVRISTNEIRTIGRSSQGVRIINLKDGDQLASASLIAVLEGEEAEEGVEGEVSADGAVGTVGVDAGTEAGDVGGAADEVGEAGDDAGATDATDDSATE